MPKSLIQFIQEGAKRELALPEGTPRSLSTTPLTRGVTDALSQESFSHVSRIFNYYNTGYFDANDLTKEVSEFKNAANGRGTDPSHLRTVSEEGVLSLTKDDMQRMDSWLRELMTRGCRELFEPNGEVKREILQTFDALAGGGAQRFTDLYARNKSEVKAQLLAGYMLLVTQNLLVDPRFAEMVATRGSLEEAAYRHMKKSLESYYKNPTELSRIIDVAVTPSFTGSSIIGKLFSVIPARRPGIGTPSVPNAAPMPPMSAPVGTSTSAYTKIGSQLKSAQPMNVGALLAKAAALIPDIKAAHESVTDKVSKLVNVIKDEKGGMQILRDIRQGDFMASALPREYKAKDNSVRMAAVELSSVYFQNRSNADINRVFELVLGPQAKAATAPGVTRATLAEARPPAPTAAPATQGTTPTTAAEPAPDSATPSPGKLPTPGM